MHTKPNNRPKRIVADMSRKVCEREADSDDSADSGHSMASMGAIKGVDSEQSLQQSSDAFTDAKQVPVAVPPGCIVCAWCAKVGIKLFTLNTPNGCKAFCSELCFTQCRRASFKKNKMCDWCKHVRHTVNYVDFQDGEQQLQFCSNKCLNQYKMNIFCNETKAHLHLSPGLVKEAAKINSLSKTSNLITPDLWLKDMKNGENDYNSVNVYKDDSDSECEVELDLDDSSKSTSGATKKRKLSSADFTKEDCELKPNDRPKDNDFSTKDKTKKELKRLKHSHKVSNSRHIGGKHSTQELGQQNEWSLRDNNESSHSNFHPSYRQKSRHSPIPTSVASMRPTVTTNTGPSHPLPLLNGNSSMTPSRPNLQISPLAAGPSPPNKIASFPRLSANMSSSRVTPLLPSQPMSPRVPPLPSHLLGAAQLEAFARMQSSLGGLRPPMPPLGAHLTHGLPFLDLPHLNLNGVLPQNGSALMPPSIPPHMSVPRQPYQNRPLLPPISVMTPYPVPILIPIPIPVPILFPVDKEAFLEHKCRDNDHNYNQQTNQNTGNDSTHTSHHSLANSSNSSASRVEAIVSKLKSKADCSQLISPSVDQTLDLRRITADSVSSSDESDNDESSESSPKNLIIKSR